MLDTVWKYYSPFEVFKDANRGSFAERVAAHRYNCEMRGCLSTYISRWLVSLTVAMLLTSFFDSQTPTPSGSLTVFGLLAAVNAVFATLAVCAVFAMGYAYISLAHDTAQLRNAGARRFPD